MQLQELERDATNAFAALRTDIIVRWQSWNFLVVQVKINRFLHFNECTKWFFAIL